MKSLHELITRLRTQGVDLWIDGDHLCYRVVAGSLTAELRSDLLAYKEELIAFLTSTNLAASLSQSIRASKRAGTLSLSHAQERLWLAIRN